MILEYKIEHDNILSLELKELLSRHLYKSIKAHKSPIYVNGVETKLYQEVKKGDTLKIDYEVQSEINWPLYESHLEVLYEDDNYLVVNKKRNLLSIPTNKEPRSLYQEILYYLSLKNKKPVVSILTRLDKKTSGLCLVALNKVAADKMEPIHEHIVRKYYALLKGSLENDEGVIETFIKKDENSIKRYVSDSGQKAISYYKVIKRFDDKTLVEFKLETGRTHQIRVHSLYISHPVIGDDLYTDDEGDLYLTSHYIKFENMDGKIVEIDIDSWWSNEGEK